VFYFWLQRSRRERRCIYFFICRVEQKLSSAQGGGCYNIQEAQAIVAELRNIQKSLTSGEKEKADLMMSLAKLKDDLTRLQLCESSPDISTLSLPSEKLSTASQTDLSGDVSERTLHFYCIIRLFAPLGIRRSLRFSLKCLVLRIICQIDH